jgi:hypothetical protein
MHAILSSNVSAKLISVEVTSIPKPAQSGTAITNPRMSVEEKQPSVKNVSLLEVICWKKSVGYLKNRIGRYGKTYIPGKSSSLNLKKMNVCSM